MLEARTAADNWAVELRQNTPFAGALSEEERLRVLSSFRKSWRAQQVA